MNHECTEYYEIVASVLTEEWLNSAIVATNAHGKDDPNYSEIPVSESGRNVIQVFLLIVGDAKAHNYVFEDIWSQESWIGNEKLAFWMPRDSFMSLLKHYRVVDPEDVPDKESDDWHPTVNIQEAVDALKENSQALWVLGSILCIDERRVTSKSRGYVLFFSMIRVQKTLFLFVLNVVGDAYKTFEPQKPTRNGRNIYILADKGDFQGTKGYTWDTLIYSGVHTYENEDDPKMYDICRQLINHEEVSTPLKIIKICR